MEWVKCEVCGDHTSIGSYLFQSKIKKFPEKEEDRVCILCGKPAVIVYATYEDLLDSLTRPVK